MNSKLIASSEGVLSMRGGVNISGIFGRPRLELRIHPLYFNHDHDRMPICSHSLQLNLQNSRWRLTLIFGMTFTKNSYQKSH